MVATRNGLTPLPGIGTQNLILLLVRMEDWLVTWHPMIRRSLSKRYTPTLLRGSIPFAYERKVDTYGNPLRLRTGNPHPLSILGLGRSHVLWCYRSLRLEQRTQWLTRGQSLKKGGNFIHFTPGLGETLPIKNVKSTENPYHYPVGEFHFKKLFYRRPTAPYQRDILKKRNVLTTRLTQPDE